MRCTTRVLRGPRIWSVTNSPRSPPASARLNFVLGSSRGGRAASSQPHVPLPATATVLLLHFVLLRPFSTLGRSSHFSLLLHCSLYALWHPVPLVSTSAAFASVLVCASCEPTAGRGPWLLLCHGPAWPVCWLRFPGEDKRRAPISNLPMLTFGTQSSLY